MFRRRGCRIGPRLILMSLIKVGRVMDAGAAISNVAGLLFFFQAEDGIRDRTVTGVQTCALPISDAERLRHFQDFLLHLEVAERVAVRRALSRQRIEIARRSKFYGLHAELSRGATDRSEERRVGEEGRTRWGADHGGVEMSGEKAH